MRKTLAIGLVLLAVTAGANQFGVLREQVRKIADQDTDVFIVALEETIVAHFAGDTPGRNAFLLLFKTKLGLNEYAEDQAKVKELERIKAILLAHFTNGAAVFDALKDAATPIPEPEPPE